VSLDSEMKTQGADVGIVVHLIDRVDVLGPVGDTPGSAARLVVCNPFAADILIVIRLFAVHTVRSSTVGRRVVSWSLVVVARLLLLLVVVVLVVVVVLEVVPLLILLLLRLLRTHWSHWRNGSNLIDFIVLIANHDRSRRAKRILDLVLFSDDVKSIHNRLRFLLLDNATQIFGQACPEDLERHVAVDVLVSGLEDFHCFFICAMASSGGGDRQCRLFREVHVHELHDAVHPVEVGDGVLARLHGERRKLVH